MSNFKFQILRWVSAFRGAIILTVLFGSAHAATVIETHSLARRILPETFYGVTSDNAYDDTDLPEALGSLAKKPVTRLVYDANIPARDYLNGTEAVHDVSFVMGLPVDSAFIKSHTIDEYLTRTISYWWTLGSLVDIWEIGNEVNGEWTGQPLTVAKKITESYDFIKTMGGRTALTLYYNSYCARTPESEWSSWSETYIPDRMKQGLDYVFLSYYEDDCPGPWPKWNDVFAKLSKIFPNSKLGIGECGTKNPDRKATVLYDFYSLSFPGTITTPKFVGGYFYWYFHQDMVPKTKPLWKEFNDALKLLP